MTRFNLLPKKFFLCLPFFVLSLFFFLTPSYAQEFKPDELIVKMRPAYSSEERLKFHHEIGAQLVGQIQSLGVDILHVEGVDIQRMADRLKLDSRVAFAEPDYKATAYDMTNDPALVQNLQWGLMKISAAGPSDSAWTVSRGRTNVEVAVLDTGIDQNHEDLQGKVTAVNNCSDSKTTSDIFGHGTHVAGIISADTDNGVGVAGLGYNISLINAKGLGDSGSGYYSWIANCIVWAADNGANVINMSLGGPSDSQVLSDAVNYAWNKGVVLVAAAGNSGNSSPSYPAYYPHVISVAATDSNDKKASFSNFGKWVDVAAPGVSIYSTLPSTPNAFNQLGYGYGSGTSMASPFVAGLAGLLFSMGSPDNSAVVNWIENNADKISGTGSNWIYGRINAYASLLAARGVTNVRPTDTPTPTPTLVPTSTPTSTPIPTSTSMPTRTPTPTPTLNPTLTPTPATSSPIAPSDPYKSIFSRLCVRFPFLCR